MSGNGDFISREAVLALAKDICAPTKWDSEYRHRSIDPLDVIELPTAAVRPVVTCGECIHGQGEKMDFWNEYKGIECIGGVVHRKDWFCADGEKREEN